MCELSIFVVWKSILDVKNPKMPVQVLNIGGNPHTSIRESLPIEVENIGFKSDLNNKNPDEIAHTMYKAYFSSENA